MTLPSFAKIWKHNKGFLLVNITGLSIGLAVSILLLLYVLNEWSFDRHFVNKDRIVQLNSVWPENGKRVVHPICTRKAYTELPQNIPGIEKAVQIYRGWEVEMISKTEHFRNLQLLYADKEFFDIFEMTFVYGSAANALANPFSIVLIRSKAEAIFGKANPVGQSVTIDGEAYTVSAVVEKMPANSQFKFDVLASMQSLSRFMANMGGLEFFTYYLIKPNIPVEQVCQSIRKEYTNLLSVTFSSFVKDFGESGVAFDAVTLPLTRIHLFSEASYGLNNQGNLRSILLLAGLAFLILILAITNFVNLFVVQGNNRSREVGIRKTNGAGNREISGLFFGEAALVVLVSVLIGIFAAMLLLPSFCSLIHKNIEASLFYHPMFIIGIIVLTLFTVVIAASYPALYLSRFRPMDIMRNSTPFRTKKKFTASIVVFQSVITIVLITVMLIVNNQSRFLKEIPAGYNPKNVMVVVGINAEISKHFDVLKQNLQKVPGVQMVSSSQHLVGGGWSGQGIRRYGESPKSFKSINEYRVLPGLCELMEFKLKAGNFFRENDQLNKNYVVLNEAAVKMLDLKDPIGEKVVMFDDPLQVIGVVGDFYYDTPAKVVTPIILTCYRNNPECVYIRFDETLNKANAAQMVSSVFRQMDPEFFLNPAWAEDIYLAKFNGEETLWKIIFISTLLSLLVAMLGLFSIQSFMVSRRIKEIGIRKVAGSTTGSVLVLLTGSVFQKIGISAMVALPVAWLLGQHWLETYSNRIHIGLIILLIPIVIHSLIALAATFIISWKAATRNPVEALRYE
jgi:putative ABC transport system permease protein